MPTNLPPATDAHHRGLAQRLLLLSVCVGVCVGVCVLGLLSTTQRAVAADTPYVPPQLEPWVDWVLHAHPNLDCPRGLTNGKPERCVWVSELDLEVTNSATFNMTVRAFSSSQVQLPGNAQWWPRNVRINGSPAQVIGKQRPKLVLPAGTHRVSGEIDWSSSPSGRPPSIQIPTQFGLLRLRVDDNVVSRPNIRNGQLVLGNTATAPTKATRDSLSTTVYRLLEDDYPMQLTTTMELEVGGSARLVRLGQALLEGFETTQFTSDLPARLDEQGNLLVQVTPGYHEVVISARATNNPTNFRTNATTDHWPQQEVWGFVPHRDLRLVDLTGAAAIDLRETSAPFDNDDTQGYLMNPDTELRLELLQRGNPNPPPNQYQVTRQLWLNFDGSGYVVNDQIGATIKQASRISANYPLGRIDVDGEAELVNSLGGAEPGIEMQVGQYEINAFSDLARTGELSATGWRIDAQSLTASLNLPPGWRLLWARGADSVSGAWLERWSLWDVFLVVFATVLAARFLSRGFAVVLALALILIVQSDVSLAIFWLVAVGLVAALRYIKHARFRQYFSGATWLWLGITLLSSIGFAVDHAREAVYPQLEKRTYQAPIEAAFDRARQTADGSPEIAAGHFSADSTSDQIRKSRVQERIALSVDKQATIEEVVVTASANQPRSKYNEDTQIQTGPGQPDWSWNRASFSWNGPVSNDQILTLTLASPAWVRLGSVLSAALALIVSALLVLAVLPSNLHLHLPPFARGLAPGLLALGVLGPFADAQAEQAPVELPSRALLTELEQRLLEAPPCFPDCASLANAEVALTRDELVLTLTYHSGALISAPLLTSQTWSPTKITIATAQNPQDRQPAVLSGAAGRLQVALPAGIHEVQLSGPVGHLDRFELGWPLNPGALTTRIANGWGMSGMARGRIARGALSFERETQPQTAAAEANAAATLAPDPAKPFVTIERLFDFGLEWTVTTVVRRVAPIQGSFALEVPLLPGEAVINADIPVDADSANLQFGRTTRQFQWRSRLPSSPQLTLSTQSTTDRRERWVLLPSNLWHLAYSGLVPVIYSQARGPAFRPYQGESLTVTLTATTPIPGTTVTVDQALHRIEPGDRQQSHALELSLRASLGGSYVIELPPGDHTLIDVLVDGDVAPLNLADNRLTLPQVPGETDYEISWTTNRSANAGLLGTLFETNPPTLATPANNLTTEVEFPTDRWVLFLGGPALGPAMLYWGFLAVVIVLALILVRIPGLPLTRTDAILLSLGLSLCNLPATLLVALWLLLLRFRANLMAVSQRRWLKNVLQVGIGFLSVVTLIQLISSVPFALLGSPDMQIVGNNSSAYSYQWFNDHSAGELNNAWVVSVPLWVYRAAMLLWSLWLAFALIRWAQWAWQAFSQPRLWYRAATDSGSLDVPVPETPKNR